MLVINSLFLIWLRILRPSGDRTELIMAMLGTLSSMGVYICGIILLANPNASPSFRYILACSLVVSNIFQPAAALLRYWVSAGRML